MKYIKVLVILFVIDLIVKLWNLWKSTDTSKSKWYKLGGMAINVAIMAICVIYVLAYAGIIKKLT